MLDNHGTQLALKEVLNNYRALVAHDADAFLTFALSFKDIFQSFSVRNFYMRSGAATAVIYLGNGGK